MPIKYLDDHTQRFFLWMGNSFVGMLLGPLIVVGAIFLLFWNESHAVQVTVELHDFAKAVVEVPADHVLPGNDGKLVHVIGAAMAAGSLEDPELKLRFADQVAVDRTVEMYQWTENAGETAGNGNTTSGYTQQWSSKRIDSSSFKQPKGHDNPPMKLTSRRFMANDAALGAFVLDTTTLASMTLDAPLKSAASDGWTHSGVSLYRGQNPSTPAVGDLRVRYTGLASGTTISVLAQQSHDGFGPYTTPSGYTIQKARVGNVPSSLMLPDHRNTGSPLSWILRAAGVAILFVGFTLFFGSIRILAAVIPFLNTLVRGAPVGFAVVLTIPTAIVTIAIAWLALRPLLGAALILVALNVLYVLWRWHQSRTAARLAAHTPP